MDGDVCVNNDVACSNRARALLCNTSNHWLIAVARNNEVLDVQDDLGDVFLHTVDGAEFVAYAFETHVGHRSAWDGRQQSTAKRVS